MGKICLGLLGVFFVAVLSMAAQAAEPVYQSEDIIRHFAAPANLGASRGLGASREVCVSNSQKCAQPLLVIRPIPFDLLVNFELNSDALSPKIRKNLKEFAKALGDPRLSSAVFSIEGHTDALGSKDYNLRLSQRRANSVQAFLVSQGVDPDKLISKGFGELQPQVKDPYDELNRRVVARIIER